LRKSPLVAESTRADVRAAANLRTRRTHTVGLVICEIIIRSSR
jgi:hypothetical protein